LRSLIVCRLLKKSPTFYEPEGSIAYKVPAHVPYPEPDGSNQHSFILSLRSILVLHPQLRLCLPRGLIPSGLPTQNLRTFFFVPMRAVCPTHLVLHDFMTVVMFAREARIMKLSVMQLSSASDTSSSKHEIRQTVNSSGLNSR
jgi:hypothetical protein